MKILQKSQLILFAIVLIVSVVIPGSYASAAELTPACQGKAGKVTLTYLDYTQTGVIMTGSPFEAAIEFENRVSGYYEHFLNGNGLQVCTYVGWCDFGGYAVYTQYPSPYVYFLILYPLNPTCATNSQITNSNLGSPCPPGQCCQ